MSLRQTVAEAICVRHPLHSIPKSEREEYLETADEVLRRIYETRLSARIATWWRLNSPILAVLIVLLQLALFTVLVAVLARSF